MHKSLGILLLLSLVGAYTGTARASPITYALTPVTISDPASLTDFTVTGSITTNGTLGAISAGDITSWSWSATNGIDETVESGSSGDGVQLILPLGIVATAGDLSASFASPDQYGQGITGGGIEFQSPDGSLLSYIANQSEQPAPALLGYRRDTNITLKGSKIAENLVIFSQGPTVPPPFVFATVAPVPVPTAITLFGSAFLALGGLGRRRRKHSV